jgi:chromosome segregation ATPase
VVFLFAAKYDVAISTACSGLDYIVVETTSAAQACVELLRRENLGVATFMILVSISYYIICRNLYCPNSYLNVLRT